MKMRKIMMILLAAMLVFITACSGGKQEAGGSSKEPAGTTADGTKEKEITISYWVDPRFKLVQGLEDQTKEYGDWEKLQAAEFTKLHPNVKIEVQALTWDDLGKKVPISITAQTNPDILRDYLGRTSQYAHQGVLENLEDLVPKEELDDYLPDYLDLYTINGHLHALPSFAWTLGLVINKELWKQKGKESMIPTPDNPYWTIDQFDQAIREVADKGKVPFSVIVATAQGDTGLLSFFWGFGAKLFKESDYSKVALNSPEGVKALEYLVKLNDDGLIQPSAVSMQAGDMDTLFTTGTVGAYGGQLGLWKTIENSKKEGKTKAEFDLTMVQFPSDGDVKNGVAVGPTGLAIFKQEDEYKRKMVVEFANFLNSTQYQKDYAINAGQFPVKKSAGIPMAEDPNYKVLQKIIDERGVEDMGLTNPKYAEIRALLQPEIQAALLKQKTPAQALQDYETAANKVLSEK
ncbi:ABC transporter substrate-binding protein [Paenibacillus eucommiae]|uniref:ABC-type glycerol-3-phosphate transport system substrate-binding protein n=1 Tax=Paenibacillus eucommiae TaxID=1355755 RepID=A0ABS4IZP1_9BACL|nr:extracellular solute-binding protein [Paenibacillus eucommiae]MBP1992461.1 ABC-type glycerol-3-phosphate transport system substrate-binding protein [Paenibacillus eucommiae]